MVINCFSITDKTGNGKLLLEERNIMSELTLQHNKPSLHTYIVELLVSPTVKLTKYVT